MNATTTTTYAVQHPSMSHALLIDAEPHHTERFLVNMAVLYVMQNLDVLLPREEFVVQAVDADTPDTYSIF